MLEIKIILGYFLISFLLHLKIRKRKKKPGLNKTYGIHVKALILLVWIIYKYI